LAGLRTYAKAFERPGAPGLPLEAEEFIEWVLSLEPERGELYLCLGLINFYAKQDCETAERDLRRFLENFGASLDGAVLSKVEEILDEIAAEMQEV